MIAPCPAMSRGTDWVVPMPPGFVSETVVPVKSSIPKEPSRPRRTRSS